MSCLAVFKLFHPTSILIYPLQSRWTHRSWQKHCTFLSIFLKKNYNSSKIPQFIACAANLPKDHRIIGHNQKSYTSECHAIRHDHPSSQRSTVLIDTPGFNNTDGDDIVVLGKIGDYLAETYAELVFSTYLYSPRSCQGVGGAVPFQ